ncbi:MAG: phospho-sugar mutase, partial [Lachnospiraceae bacterium]|nr:phospho-sugar mutase [Lachnospiraceae bacterium]
MTEEIKKQYEEWVEKAVLDEDLKKELLEIEEDEAKIEDAFYRNLEFGTGGLRGVIGVGTNRMNVYTVAKASQGLANYVIRSFKEGERRIAVSFDSRIKADLFAKTASGVFAENGIEVYIYKELMPTPCLSYAVRELNCSAGIMVTASHNPAKYNGYKVYGADGCQITTEAAADILGEIERLDLFQDVRHGDFDAFLKQGKIQYISEEIYTSFVEEVKKQSLLRADEEVPKDVAIVYSPLNGTGLKPVTRTLK